jgi:hypothetical protein
VFRATKEYPVSGAGNPRHFLLLAPLPFVLDKAAVLARRKGILSNSHIASSSIAWRAPARLKSIGDYRVVK